MIKLPDAITADHAPEVDEIYMAVDRMGLKGSYAAYAAGFNAAIEKVQRLNVTAHPVTDGRTMREHEFSQLVNELRDVPAIQSKREKIVGILKAFNIRPAAPGGQDS
jgi:hypothetical protein